MRMISDPMRCSASSDTCDPWVMVAVDMDELLDGSEGTSPGDMAEDPHTILLQVRI
jgi:hypothetical protein